VRVYRCKIVSAITLVSNLLEQHNNVQLNSVITSWKGWIICVVVNERWFNRGVCYYKQRGNIWCRKIYNTTDEVSLKSLSLEMGLTVITDMNEARIPISSTVLLLPILSVCWNGAVRNMASLVLVERVLLYFMQWMWWVVHLGMTLYAAVEEPLFCMA
jgi:hypothetical protein